MTRVLRRLIQTTVLLVSLVPLTGCFERHRTTDQLCEAYPELCADTNLNDGQCRIQRANVIWQRYDVMQTPTDQEKFKELKFTSVYQHCLEYAARIEPTELKERKTHRNRALLNTYTSIKRLNDELATSTDPEIIYYRWSQGDQDALRQFLRLEGTPALETPDLQLALATFYIAKDRTKTQTLLLRALSLYDANQTVKPEIIQTLATLSHQQGSPHHAYLWSMTGIALNMPIASQEKLAFLYPMDEAQRAALTAQAIRIAEMIRQGEFDPAQLTP
ncbi:DUF2989 domain-containing protein [Photobacterium japonica]|uniref:DUF2989 domain-containing protein n=1 Tax=Photobacterium japonica TaxID=2910235 RepID=UPI003D095A1E